MTRIHLAALAALALGACAGNETRKGGSGDEGWKPMPPVEGARAEPAQPSAPMPPDSTTSRMTSSAGTTTARSSENTGPSSIRLGAGGRAEGRLAVPKGGVAHVALLNRGPGRANSVVNTVGFGGTSETYDLPVNMSVGATVERGDEKTLVIVIEAASATTIDVKLDSKAYGAPVPDIVWDLSRAGN